MVDENHWSGAMEIRSAISHEIARQLAAAGVGLPADQQGAQAAAQQVAPAAATSEPGASPAPVAVVAAQATPKPKAPGLPADEQS
eukprot:9881842-Alexandrium_andersonii.AAC.1